MIKLFLSKWPLAFRWVAFGSYAMMIGLPVAYLVVMIPSVLLRDFLPYNYSEGLIPLSVIALIKDHSLGASRELL